MLIQLEKQFRVSVPDFISSQQAQRVQTDGGREVLVGGQEVWEEWMRQTAEDTDWIALSTSIYHSRYLVGK